MEPGATFADDFRVLRPLGAGGMGSVFVAEQRSTGKLRALKLMHPQLAASDEARRRFEQEARIGAKIDSEHVVEVQAAGVDAASGAPFLVMELLEGEDLARIVARRGAFAPAEVAAVFEQLGHAMSAAHAAGIVHRDLKPENVFLARARRSGAGFTLKVLDFGIAKLVEEGGGLSTAALGSPLWLAPEQTERVPVTPATDVWAMGLLAYHLLTGKSFWREAASPAMSIARLLREILVEPLPTASERAAEQGAKLPAGFDAFFARTVARAPEERFPDAAAAVAALLALLPPPVTTIPTSFVVFQPTDAPAPDAFAPTMTPPVVTPPPAPARSRRTLVVGVAGVVVASIAVAAILHARAPAGGGASVPSTRTSADPPVVSLTEPSSDPPLAPLTLASGAESSGAVRGHGSAPLGGVIGANPAQSTAPAGSKGPCDCPPGDPMCTCAETVRPKATAVAGAEPPDSRFGEAQKLLGMNSDLGASEARDLLRDRIRAHTATAREVGAYRAACTRLGDQACLAELRKSYP